ncbi:MAG: uracil phosphoribosyltransferase [Actinomycetota bacterium]|nr:uracil phosphoribosyltransferase [Actinomycetota bacterium]
MPTTIVDHPLVAQRLAGIRDETTPRPEFRRLLDELSHLLVYEACRTLPTDDVTVTTPLAPAPAKVVSQPPLLVPVLRAGLGMLDGALKLVPESAVGFVGLKRDEETLQPDAYVTTVPEDLQGLGVIVLDPMLATGGSLIHTAKLLQAANCGPMTVVCVLAAPEGLEAFAAAGFADVHVVTAAVDERLNEVGFIVPGLGDAGDRQFGVA